MECMYLDDAQPSSRVCNDIRRIPWVSGAPTSDGIGGFHHTVNGEFVKVSKTEREDTLYKPLNCLARASVTLTLRDAYN